VSKVAIQGNASGTGTFTIAAPNSDNNNTLTLPDDTGTVVYENASGNVGIGTSSPSSQIHLNESGSANAVQRIQAATNGYAAQLHLYGNSVGGAAYNSIASYVNGDGTPQWEITGPEASAEDQMLFHTGGAERMRINSGTGLLIGTTNNSPAESSTEEGVRLGYSGSCQFSRSNSPVAFFNRNDSDGGVIQIRQAGVEEGVIVVSGSTVSYNGGHLARWSRLADDSKDTSIVKGTVMTNLDAMVEWSHDAVEASDAVLDEDGNVVIEAVEAKGAYTENNEQLNKMAVSSVEGDPNVAGVFVAWDDDDDFNDMNIAMTGDMVIRIASDTTVQRGDLLMSAGDGTAKPQGDDIVRSKTIAKVTSTHVSHTYDDGSYLVPCVLMAC